MGQPHTAAAVQGNEFLSKTACVTAAEGGSVGSVRGVSFQYFHHLNLLFNREYIQAIIA